MKFENFLKYVIINIRGGNMNNIIELSNAIKYDSYKCTQCLKCVNECQNKSLYFDRKGIVLKFVTLMLCFIILMMELLKVVIL